MARQSPLVKVGIGVVVVAVLAVLFFRSVRSTRAEPYTVERQHLTGWTLVQEPDDPLGSWLAMAPPTQLATSLGREIFLRGGESVNYPNPPRLPLLLRTEYDRAFAGMSAEEIIGLARSAGLETATWEPHCMVHRRVSEPRAPRGVYFVLMNSSPFERFRQQLLELLQKTGRDASLFNPAALSPALIIAALDGDFRRWMPLQANAETDCLSPVEVM